MSFTKIPHRHKAWWFGIGVAFLLVAGAVAGVTLLLSGAYSTAATKQHFRITYRILDMGLKYSVRSNAKGIQVPDLERVADMRVGHACYQSHCVQCHGAPGVARDAVGRGQLPSATSLSQSAREWNSAQLFYVTQKGVRMTGMPAWEFRISNDGLWSTVAYVQRLPSMTREEAARLAQASEGVECPLPTEALPYSLERARTTFQQHACENCHLIPGVVGPVTRVGPSLHDWHRRRYIAGVLPNTPENLALWIRDPQVVNSQTLMPDLEVTQAHARDMARYLFEH